MAPKRATRKGRFRPNGRFDAFFYRSTHTMFNSLKPKLVVVLSLSALGASHFAFAQPQPAAGTGTTTTAPTTKKAKRGRKAKGGLTTRQQEKLEAALGKPLSAEQKTQLDASADTRRAALKAADEQFKSDITRITGLTPEQLKTSRAKAAAPAG